MDSTLACGSILFVVDFVDPFGGFVIQFRWFVINWPASYQVSRVLSICPVSQSKVFNDWVSIDFQVSYNWINFGTTGLKGTCFWMARVAIVAGDISAIFGPVVSMIPSGLQWVFFPTGLAWLSWDRTINSLPASFFSSSTSSFISLFPRRVPLLLMLPAPSFHQHLSLLPLPRFLAFHDRFFSSPFGCSFSGIVYSSQLGSSGSWGIYRVFLRVSTSGQSLHRSTALEFRFKTRIGFHLLDSRYRADRAYWAHATDERAAPHESITIWSIR